MKILLVRLSNQWVYSTSKPSPRKDEPLGIEYLSSGIKDHNVKLLDLDVTNYSKEETIRYIESFSPQLIGMTVPTPLILEAKKFIDAARKTLPDATTVVGGPHPSALPSESLKHTGANISAYGEGEETIKDLANGLPLKDIKGIVYNADGKIKTNPPREFIEDLDSIPFPERTILPRENYLQYPFDPDEKGMRKAGSIMTSRSCPYQCVYCASKSIFGRGIRFRSPKNVVDEIEELVNVYNVKHYIFIDDCFTLDQKRTQVICEEIIKKGLDVEWKVDTRVNTISKSLLEIMKKAGCRLIVYGVEAGNQRVLDYIKKATTINVIEKAFELTKEVGIHTHANFMLGHPTETEEEIWDSINLAKKLNPSKVGFYLCMPIPGSELYQMAKNKNAITEGFHEFRWYGKSVYNLSKVQSERLKELQEIAYKKIPKRPQSKN